MADWRPRGALPGLAVAGAWAPVAWAHTGQGDAQDFLGGLLHPLTGLDHALAMIAVGALAWSLRGRARWLLPAGFLAMLAAGMFTAAQGGVLPQIEPAVAASVAALGAMLLAGRRLPLALALPLTCVFGIVHGNAHGSEMQAMALATHGAGFLLGTACLHAAGFAIGAVSAAVGARARVSSPASRAVPAR